MTTVPLRETKFFKRGRNGERFVADRLRERGWLRDPKLRLFRR